MELPLLAIFLASFALIHSHPKHSDVIPKDYYKRQILQPIPGYIPVYIKTEEPIVRSEVKNPSAGGNPQQSNEHKEKSSFKQADEKSEKDPEPNLDEIKSEGAEEHEGAVKGSKNVGGKPEPPASLSTSSEKHD